MTFVTQAKPTIFNIKLTTIFALWVLTILGFASCSSNDDSGTDETNNSNNNDTDTATEGKSGTDTTSEATASDENPCDNVFKVIFRDFQDSHPDFERPNKGWGPCQGVLEDTLDEDRKPVFRDIWGKNSIFDPECNDDCPNGGDIDRSSAEVRSAKDNDYIGRWETWLAEHPNPSDETLSTLWDPYVPMYEGADAFYDWYHDTNRNKRVELPITLTKDGDAFVYDSKEFFPLNDLGYKDKGKNGQNYLFTTEVHLEFTYQGGEEFTFRGDDDLWIFVNGKLALDLGGMHHPFEGTIVFDQLDLTKEESYMMDIFHAERHTSASNFRITTNIPCFKSFIQVE